MLQTDKLIYVHCPKTGGIFVERVLRRDKAGKQLMGAHDPATQLSPEIVGDRLVVATLRNPWDWYVSLYYYAIEQSAEGENAAGLLAYGNGEVGFKPFLYGVTHLAEVRKMPELVGLIWTMKGVSPRTIAKAKEEAIGLCTIAYRAMYAAPNGTWVCKRILDTAQLHDGLWQVAELDPARKALWAPQNVGCHLPSPQLYDGEMTQWVAQADRHVNGLMSYRGPGGKAPRPVLKFG
jgi:hypothetical protein